MEILGEILLALHLIGMAIIVGGYFALIRSPKVVPGMLHGAYLQLITGLVLLALAEMGDGQVNHMKMGIKLLIAILVTVFAFIGNRKQKAFTTGPTSEGAPTVGPADRAASAITSQVAASDTTSDGAAPATTSDRAVATAVTNPSATMAHLAFAGAIINVLVAVFVH